MGDPAGFGRGGILALLRAREAGRAWQQAGSSRGCQELAGPRCLQEGGSDPLLAPQGTGGFPNPAGRWGVQDGTERGISGLVLVVCSCTLAQA